MITKEQLIENGFEAGDNNIYTLSAKPSFDFCFDSEKGYIKYITMIGDYHGVSVKITNIQDLLIFIGFLDD